MALSAQRTHFVGANGRIWLRGTPPKDTIRLGGSREPADDIAIRNVTHINRVPVEVCEFSSRVPRPLTTPPWTGRVGLSQKMPS